MKKSLVIIFSLLFAFTTCAYGAKYKINSTGSVKTLNGKNVVPQTNVVKYYNNYSAQDYVNSNVVNEVQVPTIQIVMDYSGSMANWINVAKSAMTSIVNQINPSVNVGFRVLGQTNGLFVKNKYAQVEDVKCVVKNKKGIYSVLTNKADYLGSKSGYCSATRLVTPIQPINATALIGGMNSTTTGGATPIVYALDRTVNQDFSGMDRYNSKKIVLITDGGETCGGDPCSFARNLMSKRNDIHIDVVLVGSNSKELVCLSQITGGHFYQVDEISKFSQVMKESMTSAPVQTQNEQKYEFYDN